MFFDVKNWAKNTRVACKVRKKWLKKYVFIPKKTSNGSNHQKIFVWTNEPTKIFLPESCDLENFFGRVDFLTHHKIHFKSCQNPPVTHFRIPQTLTSSQHVWNSDFKRSWKYVLRPTLFSTKSWFCFWNFFDYKMT